jgi:FAD/FMN-containing dehydrogenase
MRPALQTRFLRQLDESTAAVVLDRLATARSWLRLVQFRVLGGAVAAVRADETAYAHRAAPILATILHGDEQDPAFADRWTRRVAADLDQGIAGAYVNFLGPRDASRADLAYPGTTLRRLRQIKAAHDPHNVFRHNINITPEGAEV